MNLRDEDELASEEADIDEADGEDGADESAARTSKPKAKKSPSKALPVDRMLRDDGGNDEETIDALFGGHAHAIIANPPYIVAPSGMGDRYRARYASATGGFGLGVPFTERLFQLGVYGAHVAEITSNAFMKREHGAALIERVLPNLDLTHVIDTSGAFIPGHGTPTIILVGRHCSRDPGRIRCVQSKRGEPSAPDIDLPGLRIADALMRGKRKKWFAELAKECGGAKIAGAWLLTATMCRAVTSRTSVGVERRDEHIADTCARIVSAVADAQWLDLGEGSLNPASQHRISRERSDEIVAALDAIEPPSNTGSPVAVLGDFVEGEERPSMGDPSKRVLYGPTIKPRSGWASPNTDWIGDLYQSTNEWAVKKHALCQTPFFVRDLLLDYSVEPAMDDLIAQLPRDEDGAIAWEGFKSFRAIDPTCGTGHLLVAAFWRVYERWMTGDEGAPPLLSQDAANAAMRSTLGADLNPEVVQIALFRLSLAWLDATGLPARLQPMVLPCTLAVADALLAGPPRPSPPELPLFIGPRYAERVPEENMPMVESAWRTVAHTLPKAFGALGFEREAETLRAVPLPIILEWIKPIVDGRDANGVGDLGPIREAMRSIAQRHGEPLREFGRDVMSVTEKTPQQFALLHRAAGRADGAMTEIWKAICMPNLHPAGGREQAGCFSRAKRLQEEADSLAREACLVAGVDFDAPPPPLPKAPPAERQLSLFGGML